MINPLAISLTAYNSTAATPADNYCRRWPCFVHVFDRRCKLADSFRFLFFRWNFIGISGAFIVMRNIHVALMDAVIIFEVIRCVHSQLAQEFAQ